MSTAAEYSALDAKEDIESAPPEPAPSVEGSGQPAADGAGDDGSEGSEERAPLVEDVEAAGIERQAVQGKDQPKAIDQDLEAESAADKASAAVAGEEADVELGAAPLMEQMPLIEAAEESAAEVGRGSCLLYTSPSPRDRG